MTTKHKFLRRYELDTGEIFRGRTFILNNPRVHLYVMFGADDEMYWVRFSSHEYLYKKSLSKMVRIGKPTNFSNLLIG